MKILIADSSGGVKALIRLSGLELKHQLFYVGNPHEAIAYINNFGIDLTIIHFGQRYLQAIGSRFAAAEAMPQIWMVMEELDDLAFRLSQEISARRLIKRENLATALINAGIL